MLQLVALYDCKMSFRSAFILGMQFFETTQHIPNEATATTAVPIMSNALGFKRFRSAKGLSAWLEREDLEAISLASVDHGNTGDLRFVFSRGSATKEFYTLHLQYRTESASPIVISQVLDLIKRVHRQTPLRYGFSCALPQSPHRVQAAHYVDAQTLFIPFLPYEDQDRWKAEVPSYLNDGPGPRRYLTGMLRLVYPSNFVSTSHVEMQIQGMSLRNWIAAGDGRGTLTKLADDLWVWQVPEDRLLEVNVACAQAGLLVAWKSPSSPEAANKRRLPG